MAALVAMTDDTSPAASTARSSSQPPVVSGMRAPRSNAAGAMATSALKAPAARPQPEQHRVLRQDDREQVPAPVADGAEQRQLAPPLEHVPQQDGGEADRADQQPQPAQRLERRQVGVLDGVELREPLRGRASRRRRDRRPCSRSPRPTAARLRGGRVDHQERDSPAVRERARMKFASAISSSPWNTLSASAATSRRRIWRVAVRQDDLVAELLVQDVGHRVRVGGNRDDAVRQRLRQQPPRVRAIRRRSWRASPGTRSAPRR